MDRNAMLAGYAANPTEANRLVLADWLEERGEWQEALAIRQSPHVWLVGGADAWGKLMASLRVANGRRRTRTLDAGDVARCVLRASEKGLAWTGGETVANSYGYRSWRTTCVAARRSDGFVRVGFSEDSASKGSSPTTGVTGLAKNAKLEAFRAWADDAAMPEPKAPEPVEWPSALAAV